MNWEEMTIQEYRDKYKPKHFMLRVFLGAFTAIPTYYILRSKK